MGGDFLVRVMWSCLPLIKRRSFHALDLDHRVLSSGLQPQAHSQLSLYQNEAAARPRYGYPGLLNLTTPQRQKK